MLCDCELYLGSPYHKASATADGESDHGLCVTEISGRHDWDVAEFGLGLDELPNEVRRSSRSVLKAPDDDSADTARIRQVQEGLQVAIKFPERGELAFLEEEEGICEGRHVLGPLKEVQRAEVAADDPPLRFARADDLVTGIRNRVTIRLIPIPLVVGPDRARLDFEWPTVEEAAPEHVERVVEVLLFGEVGERRTSIGHDPRLGEDRIAEDGDIREAGDGFRIPSDELPVDMAEELIAVVATDDRQDKADCRVGEGCVQVGETRVD